MKEGVRFSRAVDDGVVSKGNQRFMRRKGKEKTTRANDGRKRQLNTTRGAKKKTLRQGAKQHINQERVIFRSSNGSKKMNRKKKGQIEKNKGKKKNRNANTRNQQLTSIKLKSGEEPASYH